MTVQIPNILSIAGVDPSGGAGILADVKTMSALGGYGCAVVAALTAQNTQAVTHIHPVPADFVAAQLDTLFNDVRIDATKIGMLGQVHVIRVVAEKLSSYACEHIVLDPVMVAKGGDML
jgi:hydroxymethylpyrimidine/phosphomethylpyrimidine kinase